METYDKVTIAAYIISLIGIFYFGYKYGRQDEQMKERKNSKITLQGINDNTKQCNPNGIKLYQIVQITDSTLQLQEYRP